MKQTLPWLLYVAALADLVIVDNLLYIEFDSGAYKVVVKRHLYNFSI
jgi:hypothetical protein